MGEHKYTDRSGRNLCDRCNQWKGHKDHAARPSDETGAWERRFDHWRLDADDPKNDAAFVAGWNECLDTVRAALANTKESDGA